MKKIITVAIGLAFLEGAFAAESARIRVDTRQGLFGGKLATGVEAVGEPDGSDTSSWVTTNEVAGVKDYEDGWLVREDDGYGFLDWFPLAYGETPDHDVLLLNEPAVVGGRLAADEVWDTNTLHVVRHNVVVPSGVTLTIVPEAPVKFTEEARIVVEDGGRLVAQGAWFAEIQDDEWVAGDTNLDGTNSVATGTQDWVAGMDAADYVHVLMLDGAEQIFPTRTYTRGEAYGALPAVDRYDEGFFFRGWVTNQSETVGVAADQLAEMDCPALWCSWEAIYLNISTGLVAFAAYSEGESHTVAIASNDRWTYSTDADWVHVSSDAVMPSLESLSSQSSLDCSGTVTLTADINRSETARSATLRISRENGRLVREVNVVQAAMEHAQMPEIQTADGEDVFSDYVAQVWITCRTPGVEIWYTLDGSEPNELNGVKLETYSYAGGVAGVINVYASTTIKAIAVRYDLLDSAITERRLVREATLADAMDIPDQYVTTGGDADWTVTTDVTYDGVSAVRSGAMATSRTRARYSHLYTSFEGAGILTFKWKVSCERDLTGHADWDYLAFMADGSIVRKIEGDTGWQEVTYRFTTPGYHTVEWVYRKNAGFEDINPGEDCGWVDQVSWTPTIFVGSGEDARELMVNPSWMFSVGLVGASASDEALAQAAETDNDGDGYSNADEEILGTDPDDPDSRLKVDIAEDDGVMRFSYSPNNSAESRDFNLDYRVMGRRELNDAAGWKDVTEMSDEERAAKGFRFFKVKVNAERK